jgi:hypothetical protein
MLPMNVPALLDEIRSKTVLSSLIAETWPLEHAGRGWKACCPFHEEKTPSFTVDDDKGFYHCFGCGAHGDAIRWLTDNRGLSFQDAVATLSQAAGIDRTSVTRSSKKDGHTDLFTTTTKKGGGKLNRSETVTVRLDPKLNYLCELAARAQRRTKSSFIEWAIADSLGSVSLPEVSALEFGEKRDPNIGEKASQLWHVDEPDRTVALALIAPALLTHEEQLIWRLVKENGFLWRGRFDHRNEWVWELKEENLIRDRLRGNWEIFKSVALGERSDTDLPKWQKYREIPNFDDDVPF